jgi:hypothetical protein
MFERHTKTQQQGFPVCLSVCLCASQKQYIPQRKTKPNKNIISGRKMLGRRQNQEEQEHVCQTENVCKKKKNQKNHPEQEDICQKKNVCKKKKNKTKKKKKMSAQKVFFARRKTKKPMTRSRAQVCKGWVLYSGALLVRSRFRIGEDQFLGKFAAIVRNKKMGMLSLSLSTVVAIQKVVRLRGSSRDSCNRN